jgi:hypothetical protein
MHPAKVDLTSAELDWRGALSNGTRALNTAGVLNNLGMLFWEYNEPDKAREVFGRCLAVCTFCVPPDLQTSEFKQGMETTRKLFSEASDGFAEEQTPLREAGPVSDD